MRLNWRGPIVKIGAGVAAAAVLLILAAGASPPPEPQPSPSPEPSASPVPEPAATTQEEPAPRIIRSVCTDHVCGGCDGKCRKNGGHVAVDKKGHCACTPTEGSALDRAIRAAYERRPSQ